MRPWSAHAEDDEACTMVSRRDFIRGSSVLVTTAALVRPWDQVHAQAPAAVAPRVETGDLEVNGKAAKVFGIVQPNCPPGITPGMGTSFRVRLDNRLAEETLV